MSHTLARAISMCSRSLGYHAYMAGPCFDRELEAIDYRNRLDYAGVGWVSQDDPWPPRPPEGWTNPLDVSGSAASTTQDSSTGDPE